MAWIDPCDLIIETMSHSFVSLNFSYLSEIYYLIDNLQQILNLQRILHAIHKYLSPSFRLPGRL